MTAGTVTEVVVGVLHLQDVAGRRHPLRGVAVHHDPRLLPDVADTRVLRPLPADAIENR